MNRWTLLAATVLSCAASVVPLPAASFVGAEVGVDYEDNATRAIFDSDRENEWYSFLLVDGGWRFETSTHGNLTLALSVDAHWAAEASNLSHSNPGVDLTWRRKLRMGRSPAFRLALSGRWLGYRSAIRRGWQWAGRADYTHPFGDRWKLRVETRYTHRDAESEAFDQQAWVAQLGLETLLHPSWRLYGNYRYRDGDVTSTATPAAIDPRILPVLEHSTARAPDDAFPGKIAYRLDGRTHALRIGVNHALGRHGALDLRYEHRLTETFDDFDYRNDLVRMSYLHAF